MDIVVEEECQNLTSDTKVPLTNAEKQARNETQRQLRIERGDAAPRVDIVVEEEPSEKLNSLTDAPKTGAERQAKVDAKKRDEKIAKGEQADKPPLRPITDRRLIKSITKRLQTMTLKQLREPTPNTCSRSPAAEPHPAHPKPTSAGLLDDTSPEPKRTPSPVPDFTILAEASRAKRASA